MLPQEVRIATECAEALDRGDKTAAARLAREGLELVAGGAGSPKWVQRFEHLLRLATDPPAERSPPAESPSCSFCSETTHRVVAGTNVFICHRCIRRCSSQDIEGSPIGRVTADDARCSFCWGTSREPLFGRQGSFICANCVAVCAEIMEGGRPEDEG